MQNWTWYEPNELVMEPVIFGTAFCVADMVYNPFSGAVMEMKKYDLIYFILTMDFLCIAISIFFFWLLERRYREYIFIYDKKAVEMRDFTIRFGNIPADFRFGGKDLCLQAKLWAHLET
jgi:hypothetical protein